MNAYLCINRSGVFPDGYVSSDPTAREVFGRWIHGTVTYNAPLSFEQIWKFDLLPAGGMEEAKYVFWLEADRDSAEAQELMDDYMNNSVEALTKLAKSDYLAELALVLLS